MDVLTSLTHIGLSIMDSNQLVGHIIVNYLKIKLQDSLDDTGTGRYMLDCLTPDQCIAATKVILEDSNLQGRICVKLPRDFVAGAVLPERVLTTKRTTYYRNAACDEEALLVADTGDDERLSLKELTPIGANQLLAQPALWVEHVLNYYSIALDDNQVTWWKQCLVGLQEAKSYSLDRFARYILETCHNIVVEGEPLLEALGLALPALQIPRDKIYFRVLNEKTARHKNRWSSLFQKAATKRACYIFKQNPNQSYLEKEHLENAFQKCSEDIPTNYHPLVHSYIQSDHGWNQAADDLCRCEWEEICCLFTGLKSEKFNLARATLDFFDERYPEDLNENEIDYLDRLKKRRLTTSNEEDDEFFDNHRQELKELPVLKSKWDKFVFGTPIETDDFLIGLVQCLESFFDMSKTEVKSKKLIIKSNKRTKYDLKSINYKAGLFFCKNYKSLMDLLPRSIEWNVGELFNYKSFDQELRKTKKPKINRSKAKAATQIIFYLELESIDANGSQAPSLAKQLIWKFDLDALTAEFSRDIERIVKYPFLRLEAYRELVYGKSVAQSLDLKNSQSLHASSKQNRGSVVPKYLKESDLAKIFEKNLMECSETNLLELRQTDSLNQKWTTFRKSYQEALVLYSQGEFGDSIKQQARDYSDLLEEITENVRGDKAHRLLLIPLLQLGCVDIKGGPPTCIVVPWHPLRMQAFFAKRAQVKRLLVELLSTGRVEFSDTRLFFKEMATNLGHPFYPEITIGWKGSDPRLLACTDSHLSYSLHEVPIAEDNGEDDTNESPVESSNLVVELIERYLKLYPHERSNLSVVLFNCDSARLPQTVVRKVSEKHLNEDNLRCEIALRHRDNQRLCDLYEKLVEGDDDINSTFISSEATNDFMARLRIAIMADQAVQSEQNQTASNDLVFLDNVISRHAKLDWYPVRTSVIDTDFLTPAEWSYKKPAALDDMKSIAYLTSPVQTLQGWSYIDAIASFFRNFREPNMDASLGGRYHHLPARVLNFENSETKSIFDEVHNLGNWVANFDDLIDQRQLRNQGVKVIRYKQTANQGRNIIVSSRSSLGLLKTMIKQRLRGLNIWQETDDVYGSLADKLILEANKLSGDIALRAAKRGRSVSELLGVVLSRFIVDHEIGENSIVGWYFLDDYAEWLGQKEEQIADLMALHLSREGDVCRIGIVITEAKYIDYSGLASKKKESQKQLRDTVNRIRSALFANPARIDRPLWISRLCNLLVNGIYLPTNKKDRIEDWIRALQCGECEIYVRGYSHVFISGPSDSPECSVLNPVQNTDECYQEIFSRNALRKLVKIYHNNTDPLALRNEIAGETIPNAKAQFVRVSNVSFGGECSNLSNSSVVDKNGLLDLQDSSSSEKVVHGSKNEEKPINIEKPISTRNSLLPSYTDGPILEPSSVELDLAGASWLKTVAQECRIALQHFQLKAKLLEQKITPNCAILKFEGSSNLTVDQVVKKQQEFLTSYGLHVTSVNPEPGKITISIARPERQIVTLDSVWSSWDQSSAGDKCELLVGVREENGELLFLSPRKNAPHTLIAGDTNSGKSVLMVNLVLSIAATNSPDQARIILIDPKMGVDYYALESLPHLEDNKIITEQDEAIEKLELLVEEMDRRYVVLKSNRVSNVYDLRKKSGVAEQLPYIWVIHDEFAEWMMVDEYKKRVESLVSRLGVKARAAGIFLIFAAQRPEHKVMPTTLRSQLGNRLVLLVDSEATSEIALTYKGAEKLLGRGHLIAKLQGETGLVYAQVPFASEAEIERIVASIVSRFK